MTKADKEGQRKAPILRFKGFTDDWEQRKLGTITDTYSGGTPQVSVKDYYSNNEIPFIRSSDIHKNKTELYISSKGLENSSAKLVSKGHILYALYGATSGEVDVSKIDGAINQAVLCINAHNDLNYFLMLFLSKNKDKIVRKYIQGGQGNLSASIIKKIKVFTTSKLEETKISNLVKILSDIIALYERKLKLLSQVKKYLLDNLFAEKEYPNLRFKGFTDAWEQRKLGTITDTYSGGTPQVSVKDYYSNNEIPFIRSSDIHKNKTELYISSKGLENSSAKLVSKGHILYALYGATSGEVDVSKIDGAINQAVLCINAHNDLNYFLMLFLSKNKDKIVRKYIQGGQGNLSASIIKKIKVFTTSKLEETKISNLVKILSDIIALYENKQQHLTEIKNTLLNTMFI